ncbi:hypothetical protein J6590_046125 [Homalodisca vitripennis]|nr:hypothetical protein J6590_046125 [Homalodisca vitripennis]
MAPARYRLDVGTLMRQCIEDIPQQTGPNRPDITLQTALQLTAIRTARAVLHRIYILYHGHTLYILMMLPTQPLLTYSTEANKTGITIMLINYRDILVELPSMEEPKTGRIVRICAVLRLNKGIKQGGTATLAGAICLMRDMFINWAATWFHQSIELYSKPT